MVSTFGNAELSKSVMHRAHHTSNWHTLDNSDLEQVFIKLVKQESEKEACCHRGGDDNNTPITELSSEFGVHARGDA